MSEQESLREIRKQPQRKIILHHDNAICHTSAETIRCLEDERIDLTGHSPYSPDLAPNDFCLFPIVKNKLRGRRFSSRKEAIDAFKMHVLEMHQSDRRKEVIEQSRGAGLGYGVRLQTRGSTYRSAVDCIHRV
ncbi:Histone-lysine N-methyltransferase SETMAR [Eumeta japonica]|uniref:Histone-lysine N-methyltransferase SETMAR n=1 Tax=Eumeta variegata TaxID=151549 RepID=A0A4C1Y2A4_EUMVA|nr:Histone-lysine N-methyltransferase SETMAR [Eumeta japonica]